MPDDGAPKIIIDEDWKARAQREKEEASQKAQEAPAPEQEEEMLEPASFAGLVNTFAMQGLIALGVLAPRDVKEVTIDLDEAKYIIDTLMMLREKTKSNLTPDEQGMITEALSRLQQVYVMRSQQLQEAAMRDAGLGPQSIGGAGFPPGPIRG
jgi:hypothetical protein